MSEEQLKHDIAKARLRTALAVNSELVLVYARIGHDIVLRQDEQGWGQVFALLLKSAEARLHYVEQATLERARTASAD